jgi:ATP-binding cassette, subfamily B, bacterial PglK|tara:strand:+ start:530 stop:2293 length:1764 start_codon:yes stop_codon:yes gene_type:complete
MDYLRSLKFLLGAKFRRIIPLAIIFLLSSFTDLVSIGLIGGYLSIIVDPLFYQTFITSYPVLDFLSSMEQAEAILFIGYILVSAFIIKFIFLIFTNFLILRFANQEQAKIQKLMMNGILNQEYENFILSKGGENLASIANYSSIYKDVLQAVLQLLSNSIVIFTIFIMLGVVSMNTLLILLAMLIVIFLLYNYILTSKIGSYGKQYTDGMANILQGTSEVSQGIKELKTLGKEAFFLSSVNQSADLVARSALKLNLYSILPKNIIEVMLISFIVLIISLNISSSVDLGSTLSILGIFAAAMIRIAPLVSQIQACVNSLIFGRDSIIKLSTIMLNHGTNIDMSHSKDENAKKSINKSGSQIFESLRLENISYTYPNAKNRSLKEITLEVNKGDFIGLVGPSGSGKTTLVDVILGFLKPSLGTLKLNQLDAHNNIMSWRSQCAYLPQEIFLIDGSLEQNITLDREKIDPKELRAALKLSRLLSLVEDLPEGLDTNLGDRGIRLSGGQKQRVALARSIYNKREVLILDESTSALDSATEKEVIDELLTLRNEKTIIAIAHRVSTLKECNKIYKLLDGGITGPFTYDQIAT